MKCFLSLCSPCLCGEIGLKNKKVFLNLKYLFLIILSLTLFACANVPPYKREILSKPVMQFDSEKTDRLAREHFLNSLEGSSGGFGVGGGGCGCN